LLAIVLLRLVGGRLAPGAVVVAFERALVVFGSPHELGDVGGQQLRPANGGGRGKGPTLRDASDGVVVERLITGLEGNAVVALVPPVSENGAARPSAASETVPSVAATPPELVTVNIFSADAPMARVP
jgi:hypothetical protein